MQPPTTRKRCSFDDHFQEFIAENISENANSTFLNDSPLETARKRAKPNIASTVHETLNSTNQIIGALKELENNVSDAMPFSRDGNGKDDYSYLRVRPHLRQLYDYICTALGNTAPFEILSYSCDLLNRLPSFDNPNFNVYKTNMAIFLSQKIKLAAMNEQSTERQEAYQKLLSDLASF